MRLAKSLLAAAVLLAAMPAAHAQDYPAKPLRMIVPFAPGGGIDILGRTLGQKLAERWKQPVVIENRPGASGNIGTELAAKSAADGYTLLMSVNTIVMVPSLNPKTPYHPVKDFTPVSPVAIGRLSLVANPALNVKSVAELVALARKEPGRLNYGSPGSGTPHHLAMELFKQRAGVDLTHIPYKGSDGFLSGILGGQTQAVFMPIHQALAQVNAGKLVMLSAGGTQRAAVTPNVPSLAEAAGIRDIDVDMWYAMYLPAGAPREIVTRLNAELNAILKLPEVMETLGRQGLTPTGGTPEELAALTSNDLARWAKVISEAKIKAD
ncbi:MAG: tripartite tricarboxylate transporter substrate binding protein [Betaproteobacteria bacterium]|nr:tripartite tricarboxylate transporter substrate binding protein [Betaproteobacteria bacterium]